MMPLQRACVAESQARNKLSNGPLRVQSKVYIYLHPVFCNMWAYVSCRGYVGILLSKNQGGTASSKYSPLTEGNFCQGLFY